jgi:ankyrin repeat protein
LRVALLILLAVAYLAAATPSDEVVNAVKKGDTIALKTLIKNADGANAKLDNGKTILMLAVWEQKIDVISLLISKGADINAKDVGGKTDLMLAVWKENLEIVKLLLKNGADKSAKNSDGLNASDVAELSGNGEIIDFLNQKN